VEPWSNTHFIKRFYLCVIVIEYIIFTIYPASFRLLIGNTQKQNERPNLINAKINGRAEVAEEGILHLVLLVK